MRLAIAIAARCAYSLLTVLWVCLLLEAILSWFESARQHPIYEFVKRLTEPFVAPIRALLRKIEFFRNLPIDLSHLFTMLLVVFLQNILSVFM